MNYDIIIIGAGIQGAGVAQAACAEGYRVLVVEQYTKPAQGTSSRSSKLIHGGLRYLETAQFSLVYECLQERKRLLKNAPHLVKLVPFYIPVYEKSHRKPWKIRLGLALYSLLSFTPFESIPKSKWSSLKGLNVQGLKAVFKYYDGQTDDKKLTQAVLASAKTLGADIIFSSHVESIAIGSKLCRVTIINDGKKELLKSLLVINAAGPWVKSIVKRSSPIITAQPKIDLVQGTHIIVPKTSKLLGMYYLEAPQDQRAVFVMPWKGQLLIGTTEVTYSGDPADVAPLKTEIQYLLSVYNHYFSANLSQSDVIASFAGLRVLPQSVGSAFSRPRDTLLVGDNGDQSRMFSLYGGKLTAYRATAEKVVLRLRKVFLPTTANKVVNTRSLRLP